MIARCTKIQLEELCIAIDRLIATQISEDDGKKETDTGGNEQNQIMTQDHLMNVCNNVVGENI